MQHFGHGEVAIRQGDTGSSLYIIVAGTAELTVTRKGQTKTLYKLGRGEFFGETTLFSGVASLYCVEAAR